MITTSLIFRLPAILLFCLSYWTSLKLKIGEDDSDTDWSLVLDENLNTIQSTLFLFVFPPAASTASSNNCINEGQDGKNDEKNKKTNIDEHCLAPVEIVAAAPHGRVAGVPEQVLEPPDRPVQGVLRSVKDPPLKCLDFNLVGFVLKHIFQLSGQGLFGEAVPVNVDTDAKANGLLGIGKLVAVDRDGNGWGRVADTLLETSRTCAVRLLKKILGCRLKWTLSTLIGRQMQSFLNVNRKWNDNESAKVQF